MESQVLNLQAPFEYIYCNGEIGKHIATYIVGEAKVDKGGKYMLETHSHPIVQYLNSPKGVVWNRAELTDCEVLCSEDDMHVDVHTFFLLCVQQAERKTGEHETYFDTLDWDSLPGEALSLKEQLRQHKIGFKTNRGEDVEIGVEVSSCREGYFAQLPEIGIMYFHFIEHTLETLAKRLTEEREYWEEFYDHVVKIHYTPESSMAEGFVESL